MTDNKVELFNPAETLREYCDLLADMDPEEGARMTDVFAKELVKVWVPELAAIRRAHVRELRRHYSEKEVAAMLGVTPGRIWQIVEG